MAWLIIPTLAVLVLVAAVAELALGHYGSAALFGGTGLVLAVPVIRALTRGLR